MDDPRPDYRNEYLDAGGDDDEILEDFDLGEDSRVTRIAPRSVKRRKLSHSCSEASAVVGDGEASFEDLDEDVPNGAEKSMASEPRPTESTRKLSMPGLKPLSKTQLEASQRKARKTGVIYLSRVPPFMKPSTLRKLLEPYGTVLRIFLTPEPHPAYLRRKRAGGNSKRAFVDGWIEFASKRLARASAETLNGNTIGGKKAGYYHDDIWNIKYLKGFKWDDLMEQVQGERRAREGRLRAEIQRETRERKAFLGNVEASKKERGMEAKRRKRTGGSAENKQADELVDDADAGADAATTETSAANKRRNEMRFRQNEVKAKPAGLDRQQADITRALSKIF